MSRPRRHQQQWPWRAVAWLLYAALLASLVTAAIYANLYSILADLYQNFSGPYGSFFVMALVTSLYLSSLGRYGGVLFGLQSLTYSFICPAPFTVSAVLLLINDPNPTNIVVNSSCLHSQQYLPFLLFSMSFAFRFASSRPTPDLMPFSRWFARASEYLALIRFWRASHGAPIWTPLRFLCFLTILSVGRAHELLRLWQRHRRKAACDATQARRRFRTLDCILIQRLMATSWPLDGAAFAHHGAIADLNRLQLSSSSNSMLLPPARAGFDPVGGTPHRTLTSSSSGQTSQQIRPPQSWSDPDHRKWLQHHLLSTGLYQKLLSKPEQFSFFWTQGSGLIILSGSTLLLSTSLDIFRQILADSHSGASPPSGPNPCTQDPIAWILAIYSGILFLYLLVQCFPALLARIVEADEDAKAELTICSAAVTSGRRLRPDEHVQPEEESSNVGGLQSSQTAAGSTPTSSSAEIHPSHNNNVNSPTSRVGRDDLSPATESITPTIATAAETEEQRYTDTVLQEHLLELIKELLSGTALDDIPEMREADIGDMWKFTTPTVIRALECYETLPYVVLFALLQLTARRLFVKMVGASMRRDLESLNASQGVISVLRRVIETALTKVVPAMVPVALKLSVTDIWRAKKTIVEAEMVLHQSCSSSSSRDDAESSLVVAEMKSLITSPVAIDLAAIDDRNNVGEDVLEKKLFMMRVSLMLFDLTFSYIDGILKMGQGREIASSDRSGDPSGSESVAERVRDLQCFRKLLLLLKTFYMEPYKANVLHLDVDNKDSKVNAATSSQRQLRQDDHGELLKNLEATLEGEEYWNDQDRWVSHAHNSRSSDEGGDGELGAMRGLMRCKARFLVGLFLLCLVYPLTHGAPQVETVAGESVYDWVKERKKRTLTIYDDPAPTV